MLSHHFERFLAEYEDRFTIPKRLRVFFKFDRRFLGDLCRCALRSLSCYFEVVTGSALTPGVIAAIQTFGDRINLHMHLHFLVTEGGIDDARLAGLSGSLLSSGSGVRVSPGALFSERLLRGQVLTEER